MVQTSQLETRPILSVPYIPLPHRPTKILYPGSFQSPTETFSPSNKSALPFPIEQWHQAERLAGLQESTT